MADNPVPYFVLQHRFLVRVHIQQLSRLKPSSIRAFDLVLTVYLMNGPVTLLRRLPSVILTILCCDLIKEVFVPLMWRLRQQVTKWSQLAPIAFSVMNVPYSSLSIWFVWLCCEPLTSKMPVGSTGIEDYEQRHKYRLQFSYGHK